MPSMSRRASLLVPLTSSSCSRTREMRVSRQRKTRINAKKTKIRKIAMKVSWRNTMRRRKTRMR